MVMVMQSSPGNASSGGIVLFTLIINPSHQDLLQRFFNPGLSGFVCFGWVK
jgi:hypothetical protein